MKPPPQLDEPCMSDQTLLVSVEDLINLSFGPQDVRIRNYLPNAIDDPVKESEAKIKADFDQILEDMAAAFRNLED